MCKAASCMYAWVCVHLTQHISVLWLCRAWYAHLLSTSALLKSLLVASRIKIPLSAKLCPAGDGAEALE